MGINRNIVECKVSYIKMILIIYVVLILESEKF